MERNRVKVAQRLLIAAVLYFSAPALALSVEEKTDSQSDIVQRNWHRAESHLRYQRQEFARAASEAEQSLALSRRISGLQHPDTIEDLRWLVQTEMDLGDFAAAQRNMRELVEIRDAVEQPRPWLINEDRSYLRYIERIQQLGPAELKRLRESTDQIADADRLDQLGKLDDAVKQAEAGLSARKDVLGFADAVYAERLAIEGLRLLRAGKSEQAQRAFDMALEACRVLYGQQHRQYAATVMAMCVGYRQAGKFPEAERKLGEAAAIFRQALGTDHETFRHTVEMHGEILEHMGGLAFRDGRLDAAANAYRRASDVYREAFNKDDWRVRDAACYAREYMRAAKLNDSDKQELVAAMDTIQRATSLVANRQYSEGLPLLTQVQPRLAKLLGDDSHMAIVCLLTQAEIHAARNELSEFERIYRGVVELRIAALGAQHPDSQKVLNRLAGYYNDRWGAEFAADDFVVAARTLDQAIAIATQQYGAADWHVRSLRLETEYIQKFAALSKSDQQSLRDADRLADTADKLTRQSTYAQATDMVSRALKVREEILGSNHPRTATLRYELADLHLKLDDFSQAEGLFQSALEAQEAALGRMHPDVAQTLSELGILYARIGLPAQSIKFMRDARDIYAHTKGTHNADYAWCTGNLGMSYFQIRNLAEAEPLMLEARAVFEDLGARGANYANTLNNLAAVYQAMGRDDLAEELYGRAAAIWRQRNDLLDYARCLDNRAALARRRGDFAAAEPMNLAANRIFSRALGGDSLTTAKNLGNLAALYYTSGNLAEAYRYQQQDLTAWRKNLALMGAVQSESGQIEFFRNFRVALDISLSLAQKLGRSPEESYRDVLSWKGAVFAQRRQLQMLSRRPELKPLADHLREASGRLAAAMFSLPDNAAPDVWRQQLTKLADEREGIERQLIAAAGVKLAGAVSPADLTAILPEKTALIDVLEYGRIEPQKRDEQWGWHVERRLIAFVLKPGSPLEQIDLGPSQPVAEAVDAWREACLNRHGDGEAAGGKLRELVWAPLVKSVGGTETILIAPDGPLARVPFAALPGRKFGSNLIDELAIAIVPVPQMLPELLSRAPARSTDEKDSLLLVGDINFSATSDHSPSAGATPSRAARRFPPLPGTRKEIDSIEELFRAQARRGTLEVLRGDEATKEAICRLSEKARYVHLATHGFFQPPNVRLAIDATGASGRGLEFIAATEPEGWTDQSVAVILPPGAMSGVALSGANLAATTSDDDRGRQAGILTAFEVSELDLNKTDLVALSACQTGLGDVAGGEGVLGLQRAFQLAGARTVVASLWKVDDDATLALMTEFYRRLWSGQKRLGKLEAWRQAQRVVRDRYNIAEGRLDPETADGAEVQPARRAAPFYWAAFILSGDWR